MAETSMRINALYEASGNVLWLRTGAWASNQRAAADEQDPGQISLSCLQKFTAAFFSMKAALKTGVQRGQKKQKIHKNRLLWPVTMVAGTSDAKKMCAPPFDGTMSLAGGHFVVWSWYLAVFEAMKKKAPAAIFLFVFIRLCGVMLSFML